MKQKLFTLLIAVMASLGTMFASDTQVNGIWYNFDSSTHTATVTYQGSSYNSYSGEYTGSVAIPASVTYNNEEYSVISIGYRAFYNCKSLTSVTIPNSVTSIRGDAFSYCSGLSSVTIGNGVTNIGSNAFLECENLTSVRISDLAAWCTILFERAIDQGENTQYANPLYYAGNLYLNNTLVDDLVIPNGVTEIGFQAFAYCTSITSVTIPEGVTSLGKGAFLGCSNLSSIKLPTSLTNLGTYTFSGCTGLTSIEIPDGVTSIGEYTFNNCTNLTSVVIPNSVTHIGYEAFAYCRNLTSFTNHAATPQSMDTPCFTIVTLANATLYVPAESIALYNAYPNWAQFGTIKAIGDNPAPCIIASGTCGAQGDNLTWTLTCDSVLTISGTGAMADYNSSNIPWYEYREAIRSAIIANGVTTIGTNAFYYCRELTSINIPSTVLLIRNYAFFGCQGLTSIEIPNSVTSIGDTSFDICTKLSAIIVAEDNQHYCSQDGVLFTKDATILIHCPEGKQGTYVIPNSVNSIRRLAFKGNEVLTSVEIPNSVTSIGDFAFSACKSLNLIIVAPDNSNYSSEDGVLFNKDKTTLIQYPGGKQGAYTIPNSVTSIEEDAFSGCYGITSVITPNSVINIGNEAFRSCFSLASVIIGNSIVNIGDYAFYGCSSITSVTNYATTPQAINANVFNNVDKSACTLYVPTESVEAYQAAEEWKEFTNILPIEGTGEQEQGDAFNLIGITADRINVNSFGDKGTYSMNWIDIPSVNYIDTLRNDMTVTIEGIENFALQYKGKPRDNILKFGPDYLQVDGKNVVLCFSNVSVGDSIKLLVSAKGSSDAMFTVLSGAVEQEYIVPKYDNIEDYVEIAFYPISDYVEIKETNAGFRIRNVEFKSSVNPTPVPCTIASGTCGAQGDNLTWTLSCDSVLTISGTGAMTSYSSDTIVPWSSYRTSIASVVVGDGITRIANYSFQACENLRSVTLPTSVTEIRDFSFSGCSSLISIEIPNSVTRIRSNAFWDCDALTSIAIPYSVTNIQDQAFRGCNSLNSINVDSENPNYTSVDGVLFNKEATELIQYPAGKNNTSYSIPNSVTSIGAYAFYDCNNLTSVEIPNSVTLIGWGAFCGCEGLTSITVPNTVTSIGTTAFSYCYNLTTVTLPDSITSISMALFESSNRLTSVIIPDGVTSIGYQAFLACSGLTSITIPNSVTSIENYAFYGCRNLTAITNYAITPQTINTEVFSNFNKSTCTLYVPAESVEAYQTADVWKDFGNILPIEGSEEIEVLSIAEAIQIGMALDSMATSAETYTIEGYVINAGTFYAGAKYQNWYMADDQETAFSDFQAYKCYPIDGIDTVEVRNGSKVRMTGHLQKYYDRQKALYVVEMTYTPAIILSKPQIDTITVAEALALGAELEDNASTSKQYAIRGYVSSFSPYYEQLGDQNFYIADDPNSTANTNAAGGFYVYRGIPSTGSAVNKGDLVELTCAIRKYVPASGTNIKIENSEFPVAVTVLQAASDTCIVASGTCGAQGDNLTWTLTCDSVLTISGTGAMAQGTPWSNYMSEIKSLIITNGVTSIGDGTFEHCDGLISIEIPNSVTSIGSSAFWGCSSLTSVTIPNSVTSIGASVFNWCDNLTSIIVGNGNLVYDSRNNCNAIIEKVSNTLITGCKNTIIPNSVTAIGFQAFNGCRGLTFIEIPNSVVSIGNFAFSGCNGLTSVTIPNSVTSIGEYAFSRCSGLTSIEIPSSVTSIEGGAFYGCSRMTSINAAVDNPSYCSVEGVLFNKDITTLVQYPGGKRGAYTIPSSVTSIGDNAFLECQVLTSIEIPHSVTNIGYAAFCWCTQLSTITIPSSVTNIENEAFQTCRNLTSITNYATTPQVINANVFNGVNKSTCMLYVPAESIAAYQAADVWKEFGNILAIDDSTEEVNYATLADIYNMAADSTFTLGAFDVMYVPDFQSGSNMYIKDSTGSCVIYKVNYGLQAGDHVEAGLQGKVSIYNGLHEVIPITAKEELTITHGEAPAPMVATEVPSLNNASQYVVYEGVSFTTDTAFVEGRRHTVYGSWNGQTITFYNQYYIGATLSANKTYNITAVNTIYRTTPQAYPLAVEEVSPAPCIIASGTCGAQGDNLTWTLTCDSVLTISGTGAMEDYTRSDETISTPWFAYSNDIRSVVVSEGVTTIGNYAFAYFHRLTSVEIPNSVIALGDYIFYFNRELKTIEIPGSVVHMGEGVFFGCNSLTDVLIPNSVTNIGFVPFALCDKLTYIDVADDNLNYCSLDGVLYNKEKTILIQYPSKKGSSYIIPHRVTTIDSYAFYYRTDLTTVEIPSTVSLIKQEAFEACSNLNSIICKAEIPPTLERYVFDYVDKSACTLYVPAESLEAYKAAEVWKEFGTILPIEGDLPIEPTEGEFNVLYVGQDGDSISSEAVMLHLPVAPEIAGFTFLKWQVVAGDLENGIIIQAVYQAEEPTSAPAVYTNPANPAQKLIRNGNVYILTDDKIYSITGQTVR